MIPNYAGFLALGALCCAAQAFILGAASLCVFWGPVVGASVVTYRTALFLEVGCQVLGNIAFGPRYLLPYAGVLKDRDFSIVASSPELVIYSLLCVAVVLPVWHLAAFWERVPMPPPTGLALALAGTTLIFPGPSALDWGSHSFAKPPFVTGLASVYTAWIAIPLVCFVYGGVCMLSFKHVLRWEDPFHQVIWRMPAMCCGASMIVAAYVMYALSPPLGLRVNSLSPQGSIVVICSVGTVICLYVCLCMPCLIRRYGFGARQQAKIRRMNLLGLPASVVQDVARSSAKDTGWLKYFWDCYLQQDIFRDLNQNDKLVQLHSHAEQYDASTETLFHALTIWPCVLSSIGHSGNIFSSAIGLFAVMLNVYNTNEVIATIPVPIYLRCVAAGCTCLGALLMGGRLMPVTGVQICKMTPIRTCVIMNATAVGAVIGRILGLDIPYVYLSFTGILVVGLVEGITHVNWTVANRLILWWALATIPVFLFPAFLTWQGTTAPSVSHVIQNVADSAQIRASNSLLRNALGQAVSPEAQEVADLRVLQDRVQQLAAAYAAVVSSCANSTV